MIDENDTTPIPVNSPADLSLALSLLDARMRNTLNTGLQQLSEQIAALATQHHSTILAQERRNATFATNERADHLADRLAALEALRDLRASQLQTLTDSIREVQSQTSALRQQTSDHTWQLFTTTAGWIAMGAMALISTGGSFLLTHLHS